MSCPRIAAAFCGLAAIACPASAALWGETGNGYEARTPLSEAPAIGLVTWLGIVARMRFRTLKGSKGTSGV